MIKLTSAASKQETSVKH